MVAKAPRKLRLQFEKAERELDKARRAGEQGAVSACLLARAKAFRKEHTQVIDTEEAFYEFFKSPETGDNETAPIHAGFALTHFNGDPKLEERIKNDLAVTVRCIPVDAPPTISLAQISDQLVVSPPSLLGIR